MRTIEEVVECFEYWKTKFERPRARLDEKRRAAISKCLHLGYVVQDVKDAIEGCSLSAFHMGENKFRKEYNDIELICRDAAHIDEFIGIYANHQKKRRKEHEAVEKKKQEEEQLARERAERVKLKVVKDGRTG